MIDYGITIPNKLECFKNTLFVEELEHGEKKTDWGFIIPEEKMDYEGNFIHPRWAKVLYKADNIKDFDIGDWILISYGLWSSSILTTTNGVEKNIWFISEKSFKDGAIIAKSKTKPKQLENYI